MRRAIVVLIALAPLTALAQVPPDRIVRADAEPGSWLTYSGNYQSHRFSPLTQITPGNVARLKPAWVYQVRQTGIVETSPIVADGVMYITEPPSTVTALDVRTGRPLWTYTPAIPTDVIVIGSPPVNRGVAILGDTVFFGTVHGHLIALDARSGAVRWDTTVDDNKFGYYVTSAPLALDGRIIVGVSGAEAGIRGFLDAYDPKTGARVWRTHTIPAPGEPGSETWTTADSWKTGGGSAWLTGSYDPALNLVYWGTGNPGPDWNGDLRRGDNLYTCSLIALNPTDGAIKWHFQFTPHDIHDWDANEIPVLFDAAINGRPRKLVAMANRNAFYYVLDRETGEFISATPYAKQTWAERIDAKGRPIRRPGTEPSVEGTLVFPNIQGASNWPSPSYSPRTALFYQATREMGTYFFKGEPQYKPGEAFVAGGGRAVNGDDAWGAVRALEATTGKLKWEFKLLTPPMSGVLSTAGGLVFGGTDEGNFFALDAGTGKPLWDLQLGGAVRANPMSFAVDGKQYVAPIVYNSCVTCHRPGEVAPMSLMTYQDVRPWAKSIRVKVANREMPPWGADPHYGTWKDDRSLTDAQIDTIVKWVDAGAPKGDDADLPPAPTFAGGWTHGEPDVVIEMPVDFEIPAEGEVPVIDFFTRTPFAQDVYVKALDVRPGTPTVVHHAGLYVIDRLPDGARLVNGRIIGADGKQMSRNQVARANGGTSTEEIQKLLSFVPGRGYEEYQGDAGQLIKAGSYIDFYMHYTPSGTPQKDRTKLALYFAKPGQAVGHQIYHSFSAAGPTSYIVEGKESAPQRQRRDDPNSVEGGVNLPNIPPYAENFKVVSVHTIREPITLYGLTPHLHLRGKSMKYMLTLPDGREEVLLDVPKYDFNWQLYYELQTPQHIPAGSKVTVVTLFDNSPKNRYNPAPEKEVFWSEQSWDEMYAPQARITVDSRELKKTVVTSPQQQERK